MYELTKKNVPFIWSEEQELSFLQLKDILTSPPILRPPDYECLEKRPLILSTDAGPLGGGGYLGQEDEEGRRYVCRYESFLFDKTQQNYSQVKRELLVIVRLLKQLRIYVYGTNFVIESDCLPAIQMIRKLDLVDPTLTRWVTFIQLYCPELKHVPGKENVVADELSRRPHESNEGHESIEVLEFLAFSYQAIFYSQVLAL
jgi:hypothetical protein